MIAKHRTRFFAVLAGLVLLAAACGDSDDGVEAAGTDVIVQALSELENVEVTVVAPVEDTSGSGNNTTDNELVPTEAQTTSGHPAIEVDGLPADIVNWALDGGLDETPHLIVSGVNSAQTAGPVGVISGTVGAARTAPERGVPAISGSQAPLDRAHDYVVTVDALIAWVMEFRDRLTESTPEVDSGEIPFYAFNGPTCGATGDPRGVVEVPVATESLADGTVDCSRNAPEPTNDLEALVSGWTSSSIIIPSQIPESPRL